MIAKDGNVVWCARCERRAATSYCEAWLCGECYQATHARNKDGVLLHALRGDTLSFDDARMMVVKVQFTADGAPLIRRAKRSRG